MKLPSAPGLALTAILSVASASSGLEANIIGAQHLGDAHDAFYRDIAKDAKSRIDSPGSSTLNDYGKIIDAIIKEYKLEITKGVNLRWEDVVNSKNFGMYYLGDINDSKNTITFLIVCKIPGPNGGFVDAIWVDQNSAHYGESNAQGLPI